MSNWDITINDREFKRALEEWVHENEGRSYRDGVVRAGIAVENRAKELCPVDTGNLRSSINHQGGKDEKGVYCDVGTDVTYGPYVEFGTSRMKAKPFMRPALHEVTGGDFHSDGIT